MAQFERFPQLETDRLVLREMTLDDAGFYFHHFNKDEIVEGCCFAGPASLKEAKEELERYCIRPFRGGLGIRWGIGRRGSGDLIGTCGYYDWNRTMRKAEIGYDLDPAYWGSGIMTEALQAILKYGFERLNLNRIQAIIDSKNTRSIKLVERLGFKNEGVFRQNSYFKGQFRDDAVFSLLKHEWTKS